jgi:hypothetical protein
VNVDALQRIAGILLYALLFLGACGKSTDSGESVTPPVGPEPAAAVAARPDIYAGFRLQADLSGLSGNQLEMIKKLIEASKLMDELFWRRPSATVGARGSILSATKDCTNLP